MHATGEVTRECFFHNVEEECTVDSFRVCGECNHVYRTREEFVAEFAREYAFLGHGKESVPVHFGVCPLCAHDF